MDGAQTYEEHHRGVGPSERRRRRRVVVRSTAALLAALSGAAVTGSGAAWAVLPPLSRHARFMLSAVENADRTVARLPLYQGVSHGQPVSFVVTEASDQETARRLGVNFSPRLNNAKGTPGVQQVTVDAPFGVGNRILAAVPRAGTIVFPATVDFSPVHQIAPGPAGFPPSVAEPGAVGEAGYTPLIELANGVVLNAPHVANNTGTADKVISLDRPTRSVMYQETEGRYEHKVVHYMSFEATSPVAAAIEDVTFAPALEGAPIPARQQLVAFVNGQTGASNPNRQGLNSTLLDRLDPLNVLREVPLLNEDIGSLEYSPLWGIRFGTWTDQAVASGANVRQTDFDEILALSPALASTAFAGFTVNCPVVSVDIPIELPTGR
jgi:hypothetical protein